MDKLETDAKHVLNQLSELSAFLASPEGVPDIARAFKRPLEIMQKTMSFDVSVFYKITNVVENSLLLRVVRLSDPDGFRPDLYEGKHLQICLSSPDYTYINEAIAFETRGVSAVNVPGLGCDIMGFIYLPESFGGGYLFGGDFSGEESKVKDYEASVCGIMCNYLSTILIKGQLEDLAINDNLTGLFNSRKIKEEVDRICRRFQRRADSCAGLALCDIDHFKAVNDTWGHLQGDVILREVGGILKSSMREGFDVAGRYGGEEFLLVFDETDGATAFEIVERIREKIQTHKFTKIDESGAGVEGKHISITISAGIAENSLPEDGTAALGCEAWISRADQALYRAKEQGRNQTLIF